MTPSSPKSLLARFRPALVALSCSLAAFTISGCGGTNSETPWPVEPEDVDLGPEGETRTNESLGAPGEAAPGGAKTAPKSKPTAKPKAAPEEEAPKQRAPEPSTPSNPSTQF